MARVVEDVKEMLREQVEFKELLYQMTRRDLLLRYKQTVMGFAWAVFMPVINTILFTFLFQSKFKLETPVPYPVYAFAGLLVWNFFSSALRFSTHSLTGNMTLVAKVYFPREAFPFSAVLVSAVDFAVGLLLLFVLMAWFGVAFTPVMLFLPVVFLVHAVFTAAVGLFLAMANLFYRDVKYIFDVAIQLWMFGSSVLYPIERFAGGWERWLALNPMTPILDAYRDVLLLGRFPDMFTLGLLAVMAVVGLAAAWLTFHRAEYQFAELL